MPDLTIPTSSSAQYRGTGRAGEAVRSDVCIVGNDAIAKTASLGFSQAGHSVTFLLPSARIIHDEAGTASGGERPWDVRVYVLNHTAYELLASLKVWGELDLAGVQAVDAMVVNGDGEEGGSLGFDAFGAHAGTLAWIVEDGNLNSALDGRSICHSVRLVEGCAMRLACSPEGVAVELEDGRRLDAALVVGADGRDAWLRGQCDIGIDYRAYRQRATVTNFACGKPHNGVGRLPGIGRTFRRSPGRAVSPHPAAMLSEPAFIAAELAFRWNIIKKRPYPLAQRRARPAVLQALQGVR